MTALHHYKALAEQAVSATAALALVEQMRKVERAHADAEKANSLCQRDDYERVWNQLKTEEIALDRACEALGLDMQWRAGL